MATDEPVPVPEDALDFNEHAKNGDGAPVENGDGLCVGSKRSPSVTTFPKHGRHIYVVLVGNKSRVEATLDTTAQHTLSWKSSITFDGATLPTASCNLYTRSRSAVHLGALTMASSLRPLGGSSKS